MPKISVLMPSYNHERYVEEAVHSVLDQSFKDFELIVVDDASRDSTLERLQNIKDPRLRLMAHPVNKGVSVTVNDAFAASSGEYVALIASDDRWHSKKLRAQSEFLDANPRCLAVFSTVAIIDEHGEAVPTNVFKPDINRWTVLRDVFKMRNLLNAPSEMLRRSAVKDGEAFYDPRFLQLQDLEQHLRIALRGDLHVLPFPFVHYRRHGANLSGASRECNMRSMLEYALLLDLLLAIEDPSVLKKMFTGIPAQSLKKELIPYLLGRKALESGNPFQQYWGYRQVSRFFADSVLTGMLEELAYFTVTDFYALSNCLALDKNL